MVSHRPGVQEHPGVVDLLDSDARGGRATAGRPAPSRPSARGGWGCRCWQTKVVTNQSYRRAECGRITLQGRFPARKVQQING